MLVRALAALLTLGYLVGTVLLGLGAAVSGEFACSHVECASESPWYDNADAWQWDAMIVLGLASVPVGFVALATTVSARRVAPAAALVSLHSLVIGAAIGLMLTASVVNRAQLALGFAATVGAGGALIYVRRRARL
jgi:hypothetical protein